MVTFEEVRATALAMPGVEDGTSYGTAALKAKKKLMVRLKEEGDVIVVKMPFDLRAELMEGDPDTYFVTDHYEAYEWVLVRLARLPKSALADLLKTAYKAATLGKKPLTRTK